jgi:hypothetical protein
MPDHNFHHNLNLHPTQIFYNFLHPNNKHQTDLPTKDNDKPLPLPLNPHPNPKQMNQLEYIRSINMK